MKVLQVCEEKLCDKKSYTVKVGNTTHNFCCENGFKKSLDDFAKSVK